MENETRTFNDPVSDLANSLTGLLSLIPGRDIVMRYIASSYQNDPVRSLLELILLIFAVRTILQNRTRSNQSRSNFVQLDDKVCGPSNAGNRLPGQVVPSRAAL